MPVARALAAACLAVLLAVTGAGPAPAQPSPDEETSLERDDPAHLLAVVTKQVPISPLDYEPDDLVTWPGTDYRMRAEVREQLERLFAAAREDGHGLRVISGYRSYDTQAGTYDYWVRHYGRAAADATSARPGHSEHQTGLAVDLDSTTGECYLEQCFGETAEGQWVAEHAHEFGFLLSYPSAARALTGFAYEPWHLRYVGPRVATDMHERGVLLLTSYLGASASSARIGELLGSRG
ncbi:M15 family metallopeptidase [Ornithinimicrobium cavernae]|uniref:M15 family metallopeptidase n=1 Tax=Ornithinimicrobium cavernae TaxID=2666047 RepID=UPI001F1A8261|nr:M15 family metallopeptidase [Ornithinimicrobium cavernae]